MYPGTAHCQLCMHTSYRSAHQLLRNTVNSGTDSAEFISHSASPMFELDRQSEFQYSTRSSIWPISESPYKLTILTRIRSMVLDTLWGGKILGGGDAPLGGPADPTPVVALSWPCRAPDRHRLSVKSNGRRPLL